IKYISDSRSLKFVDDILEWTNGVDVVLNTLSGEALAKSFELLAPYGRFIEIGKRDINENSRLAMAAFDRNLMFVAVDLDRMLFERPDLFQDALREVRQHFEMGTLKPLPTQVFPAAEVADAFRLMAQARHMGKITVRLADQPVQVKPLMQQKPAISPDCTYMVTGGFSGLGLEVAKWMVQEGATHLVLVSRSGANSDEARAALHDFESQGVKVWEAKTDIADVAQAAVLMLEIQAHLPPLRGIVHSAMVLEDDVLIYLDEARFNRVLSPKILGAWNLHLLTQEIPLDFFVLFSSVSSYIGNPRQANYVAANAFLDALAYYRRSHGLAGMCLNWGSISRVGAVARNPKVEQYLQQLGMEGLEPEDAARMLGTLIQRNPIQMSVMKMNWQKWANSAMNVT
ncbi:MAG: SDR family NAD(P)-dependent oxidoreductase, partial [Anaerolineae bacterium]|nr:SDR family NAD(P)-dependent oxidoreductase [Anaerolineae bacterium]